MLRFAALGLLLTIACGAEQASSRSATAVPGGGGKADTIHGVTADVLSTRLAVDLAARTAVATIEIARGEAAVSLEAAGLTVRSVKTEDAELPYETTGDGLLRVELPDAAARTISVDYAFEEHDDFNGLLPAGSTNLWPYHCGNLFPCNSSPADGQTFELALSGVPAGARAIYPTELAPDVPPYTIAWAVGAYQCEALGATAEGTQVEVCYLPRGKSAALRGTGDLVAAFDWYEQNLGPYRYGQRVASVAARWGNGGAGGMEHHPFWHVATESMDDPVTHAHEAAHGWYGTGVRIRCWEDFVLSEGTVSYLTARALGAVGGAEVEAGVWDDYREELLTTLEDEDIVAWPDSCGEQDILRDGLFSNIVYMKGAFFYRAVAEAIGVEALDRVLAGFYRAHAGQAMGMADMLAAIRNETGFDPQPLADHWLRSRGNPF